MDDGSVTMVTCLHVNEDQMEGCCVLKSTFIYLLEVIEL